MITKHLSNSQLSRHLLCLITLTSTIAISQGTVIQTNFGTGDKSIPGYAISSTDLLQTNLASASRTGEPGLRTDEYFYAEGFGGYVIDLSRLTNGEFGSLETDRNDAILPNQTTITFAFDLSGNSEGFSLTNIRTYAGWDDGRDGQAYTVQYSTVTQPETFLALATVNRFDNTDFPNMKTRYEFDPETGDLNEVMVPDRDHSFTLVELTSTTGELATNVAQLRFIFNGIENGGTAFREFDVFGSAVPEPSSAVLLIASLSSFCFVRRRRPFQEVYPFDSDAVKQLEV